MSVSVVYESEKKKFNKYFCVQAPPRRTSFGKTKQAKYFAAPGEPSISESEESLVNLASL